MSRYNNVASLTDLKKLRNTTGRFKNNAHQQRGVATEAEGLVVLGRGQLQPANKKKAEKAAIDNEPGGAAAGDEEIDDVPRHRHATVGRD